MNNQRSFRRRPPIREPRRTIHVYTEGETEEEYISFLRRQEPIRKNMSLTVDRDHMGPFE
jgi:hypothetical protein